MLILAAHYGIILNHVQAICTSRISRARRSSSCTTSSTSSCAPWPRTITFVLACSAGAHLATALREVGAAASALRAEMY
jgi:hypothetical protein